MEKTNKNFGEYLETLSNEEKMTILKIDQILLQFFPKESRGLWSGTFWGGSKQDIIGYGDIQYTNRSKKKIHWFTIGIAVQKNYYSLYINATEDKKYLVQEYKETLGKIKLGSSSVSFKKIEDIHLNVLTEIFDKSKDFWVNFKNNDE